MTTGQFHQWSDFLTEAAMLVTRAGQVLGVNREFRKLGIARGDCVGRNLAELSQTSEAALSEFLRLASRSRQPVVSALTLFAAGDRALEFRCDGMLVQRAEEAANTTVLLKLTPREKSVQRYRQINEKITELNREVQRRALAEKELLEHNEYLRVTLTSIGDGVIVTDADGNVALLNPIAEQLTGWTTDVAAGLSLTTIFDIVNEKTRQPVENPATRALRDGVVVGLANHTILIARDGAEYAIDDSAAPMRAADGTIMGCVLVFRDVTQRRQSERENLDRERQARLLAAIVASSDDAIISKSLDGIIQSWNVAAERIFGYTQEQAVGRHVLMLIPPERADEEDRIIAQIKAGEHVEHFDTVRLRSDGRRIPVALTVSPIKDGTGRIVGASKIARDISDRKRHEAELEKSEERFRLALEGAELGSWNIDAATNHLTTDERFRVIFQGTTDPITYEEAFAAIHPDDRERIYEAVEAATDPDNPNPYSEEYRVVHPDGSIRWVFGKGRANFSLAEEGLRQISFNGTVMDITRQRQMRDELRDANARLSEADRRKDEFLATLAHELRNPLAPIRTGLEVIKTAGDDAQLREEVRQTMQRQVEQMVHLIDDLLDVSRITRGVLQLRLGHVEVRDIVQSAIEATRPLIDEAGHELTVSLPAEPLTVWADPTRLAQMLSNLLNNAAKYTPVGGQIWLSAQRTNGNVELRVKDTGLGISPDKIDMIFEMFGQIDQSRAVGTSGLGIGLTLVKTLTQMHGGTIEVHSDGANQGSEFTLRLPLIEAETSSADADQPKPVQTSENRNLRVLVVDDNEAAAKMLEMLVKMHGCEVRRAGDGQEAIDVAAEFLPEIVLMDIGMPRMNGYEAARQIRRQSWGRKMVLAALTGWGQSEDRKKTREAGFDHHLVKPAEPAALKQLLATVSATITSSVKHSGDDNSDKLEQI